MDAPIDTLPHEAVDADRRGVPSGAPPAVPSGAPLGTVYRPRHPVDLRLTLGPLGRGPYDPTTVWHATGVWRTFRTPFGPATLRLSRRADGIEAAAWGPGAAWAIEGVPGLLGAGDDWSGLDVGAHPLLRTALHRRPGLRLTRTRRVFEALVPAIIEQKVTSLEAYRSWARLVRDVGEPAPGPAPAGMRVVPAPERWRLVPSWQWHAAGVDPRRSRAVVEACRVASALEPATDAPVSVPNAPSAPSSPSARIDDAEGCARLAGRLRAIAGIGVWTAAETTQRSQGDPDAVSVGDYHLASFVGAALTGHPVDDDGMLELLEPWAGQRQRVVRLILASGFHAERRGPRATIHDHRRN